MNATLTRPTARPTRPNVKAVKQDRPMKPDARLWKTDKNKAFEVGVQWFLAVSRAA